MTTYDDVERFPPAADERRYEDAVLASCKSSAEAVVSAGGSDVVFTFQTAAAGFQPTATTASAPPRMAHHSRTHGHRQRRRLPQVTLPIWTDHTVLSDKGVTSAQTGSPDWAPSARQFRAATPLADVSKASRGRLPQAAANWQQTRRGRRPPRRSSPRHPPQRLACRSRWSPHH